LATPTRQRAGLMKVKQKPEIISRIWRYWLGESPHIPVSKKEMNCGKSGKKKGPKSIEREKHGRTKKKPWSEGGPPGP